MPMFNFKCCECEAVFEKFVHPGKDVEFQCEECGCTECEKVFGQVHTRTWMKAKELFDEKIDPEVERIRKEIREGDDNAFLDIAGNG
jgi:putative FmdB family regulatory protein